MIGIFGFITGSLTICFREKDYMLILSSAYIGSQFFISGISFFIGGVPSEIVVIMLLRSKNINADDIVIPDAYIYYTLGFVAMFFITFIF